MHGADRPVLVIHGVANRSYDEFAANVKSLQDGIGPAWRLIPVYWGDLGAPVGGIADAVPSPDVGREASRDETALAKVGDPGRTPQAESRAIGLAMLAAARSGGLGGPGLMAADPVAEVQAAAMTRLHEMGVTDQDHNLAAALGAQRARLEIVNAAADPQILAAIGVTIAERYVGLRLAAPEAVFSLGVVDKIEHAVDKTLDAVVGAVVHVIDGVGSFANDHLREWLLVTFGTGIGDVLRYQGNQVAIQERVRYCLRTEAGKGWGHPDQPIPILGHSLGGIIGFDLAVRQSRPISIDPLITFGSQSSIVEIFDPRKSLVPPFAPGHPIKLPSTIGYWLNVWSSLDPLAFSAQKVFRGAADGDVIDVRMSFLGGTDLFTHDDYWTDLRMFDEARRALVAHGPR